VPVTGWDEFLPGLNPAADAPPPWARDLVVNRGGDAAEEVVLLNAENSAQLGSLVRVAAAWASAEDDRVRPWVAFAMTAEAAKGVLEYFTDAPGERLDHDEYLRSVHALLPLDRCPLTVVEIVEHDQDALVELSTHPPAYPSWLLGESASQFRAHGFDCEEPGLDDSYLSSEVRYATGETGYEQVIGWDDLYSESHCYFLQDAETVFVSLRSDVADLDPEQLAVLAGIIPGARRANADQHGPEVPDGGEGEPRAPEPDPSSAAVPAGGDRLCPSSGEDVGRMIEIWGSDEWRIECPTCGAMWAGGSTVLIEHDRVR
jgi:hypothetical protein